MNEVLLRLQNNLNNIAIVTTEKALRIAGLDAEVLVRDRVQQSGDSTVGRMRTKSLTGNGIYSKFHYLQRQKKGLQNSFVDLTFNGDLWLSWRLLYSDNKVAEIGFNNQTQGDKATYLEDYYGEIFGLTNDERNTVIETFKEEINQDLKEWV